MNLIVNVREISTLSLFKSSINIDGNIFLVLLIFALRSVTLKSSLSMAIQQKNYTVEKLVHDLNSNDPCRYANAVDKTLIIDSHQKIESLK